MSQTDYEITDAGDGTAKLRLVGDWTTTALGRLPQRLGKDLDGRKIESVDTRDLGRFDTAGALALVQASHCGVPKSAWTERPEAGRIYTMIEALERKSSPPPKQPDAFTRAFAKIGRGVYDFGAEAMLSLAWDV
jgi:phospholipid/cholesterol/gamma-HCH transport system permease protein